MTIYNFNYLKCKFIKNFLNPNFKVVYWKEYGVTEWHTIDIQRSPKILKMTFNERKIIQMMLKLELLLPEIENDEEYSVQRALGCVIGRIYYMPKKMLEELKDVIIDI